MTDPATHAADQYLAAIGRLHDLLRAVAALDVPEVPLAIARIAWWGVRLGKAAAAERRGYERLSWDEAYSTRPERREA